MNARRVPGGQRRTASGEGGRSAPGRVSVLPAGDEGQILLLVIAYAVIALLLVTVIAGISSVYLQRKGLQSLADAAAADAADAASRPDYFAAVQAGIRLRAVPLTDQSVRDAAAGYLGVAGQAGAAPGLGDVAIVTSDTGTDDGVTAVVVVTGTAHLPVVSSVLDTWGGGIGLRAGAQARAPLGP